MHINHMRDDDIANNIPDQISGNSKFDDIRQTQHHLILLLFFFNGKIPIHRFEMHFYLMLK